MNANNRSNGFRQLSFGQQAPMQGRGFGAQHEQPHGGYYQEQQDDNQAVAWVNLYLRTDNDENKKLGKGIPLRESSPIERALLDLFFDENMNPREVDMDALKAALVIDVRAAGSPDQEVRIALGGSKPAAASAPRQTRQPRQAAAPQPEADAQAEADPVESLEPEQRQPRQRPKLRNQAK